MKTTRHTTRDRNASASVAGSAPGLRAVMTLLAALALAVGFATARAQTPAADSEWSGYEDMPYRVNIWHDRGEDEIYERGETVRIHFETNHDAYAVVYRVDAEGFVEILWPRSRYDDGFVFGHHTYNLPTPGAERIRAADSEGVEYVQALVSAYPFDLRGLDVDFHHESEGGQARAYYVAGDPFLAMNDINYAVTGLEDAEDYVVTNYVSYYVHRQVEHPRYMCLQCHDEDVHYDPYDDTCVVEIHYDYSWDNGWFDRYHYYPVYYYPAYYYVDPWTWRPWINYWYRPWYAWPHWNYRPWGFDCYVWNYSPYSRGDVRVRYKDDNRRYRPLVKDPGRVAAGGDYNHPEGLVKTPRPTAEMEKAMGRRIAMSKGGDAATSGRGKTPQADRYKNTGRTGRTPTGFKAKDEAVTAPGIRVPSRVDGGSGTGSRTVRGSGSGTGKTAVPTVRTGRRGDGTGADQSRSSTVRPVKPNTQGERIWRGGSRETKRDTRTVKPGSNPSTRRSSGTKVPRVDSTTRKPSSPSKATTVKPSKKSSSSTKKTPTTRSSSKSSSSKSSGQSVKSSSGSRSKSSGAATRSRSSGSSSSRSKGSSSKSSSRGRG